LKHYRMRLKRASGGIAPRILNLGIRLKWVVKVKVKVILWLAISRQSVRLGTKPSLRLKTRDFFRLNPCSPSPYITFSLTRRWGCLLWICLAFVKCTFRTRSMLLKTLYTSPLSVQASESRLCLCYVSYATTAA
jgi:hypothetical protein